MDAAKPHESVPVAATGHFRSIDFQKEVCSFALCKFKGRFPLSKSAAVYRIRGLYRSGRV